MLPQNVDVLEYLAYIRRSTSSKEETVIEQWRFEPDSICGLVTGLNSHAGYSVFVSAKVRDMDGTLFEIDKSSEVHVFVPGKAVCTYWYSGSTKLNIIYAS